MRTIRRLNQPPEQYVLVPLDAAKAAKVIRRAFTPEQCAELVRRLHWVERDVFYKQQRERDGHE